MSAQVAPAWAKDLPPDMQRLAEQLAAGQQVAEALRPAILCATFELPVPSGYVSAQAEYRWLDVHWPGYGKQDVPNWYCLLNFDRFPGLSRSEVQRRLPRREKGQWVGRHSYNLYGEIQAALGPALTAYHSPLLDRNTFIPEPLVRVIARELREATEPFVHLTQMCQVDLAEYPHEPEPAWLVGLTQFLVVLRRLVQAEPEFRKACVPRLRRVMARGVRT